MERIELVTGDITRLEVDAIVNAANSSLLGGGGVDGAIHRAAGPELLEECRLLNGCPVGEARLTEGYRLPARYVIHTVGPVWHGGIEGESGLLAACYRESLRIAHELELESVAFPAISTGAFRYPRREAAHVALTTVAAHLQLCGHPVRVLLVSYSEEDRRVLEDARAELRL